MKAKSTLLALAAAAATGACSGSSDLPTSPAPLSTPTPPPPAMARYRVTFESTWTAATHPSEAPPNPHFSGLIGATHRDPQRFWTVGALASEGIRAMAERGRKSPLDEEIQAAISAGTAQYLLSGGAIDNSPGRVDLEFTITRDHPLVTLVSMVAPSPDWFVGVTAMNLLAGGDWAAERVVPLLPYDAGTDSGVSFLSRDLETRPRDPVALLQGPFTVGGTVPPLGTFTFRRLS